MVETQAGPVVIEPDARRSRIAFVGSLGVMVALHLLGWAVLLLAVAPQNLSLGTEGVFGVGIGLTAYLLGVRFWWFSGRTSSQRSE